LIKIFGNLKKKDCAFLNIHTVQPQGFSAIVLYYDHLMAVFQCSGENKYGSQNSSGNTQSTYAVLQNVHTETLIVRTCH